jgi:hypothetical protein
MDDTDRLLHEAGERWRASQPPPPGINMSSLEAQSRRSGGFPNLLAGVVGAALVLAIAVIAVPRAFSPGSCAVTRPDPPFVAPSPHLESAPASYGSAWFGSAQLWTMLNYEGEVWAQLPKGPDGFGQKTFWWSADWRPGDEPEPAITVTGTRLDGPGTLRSAGGTNAGADFGVAMLVGIEIPTAGCWQITGQYRDASLSYVVRVEGD